MKKISLYWRILSNRIRFAILKITNPKANISVDGSTLVSSGADIEVGINSLLQVGCGLHVRKNAILAVRDKADLLIDRNVFINRNTIIIARQCITIGEGVTIGPNVCIYDHDHNMLNLTILKGVTIGEGAVGASGCIVTKDVPSHTVLIQKRNSIYKDLDDAK